MKRNRLHYNNCWRAAGEEFREKVPEERIDIHSGKFTNQSFVSNSNSIVSFKYVQSKNIIAQW